MRNAEIIGRTLYSCVGERRVLYDPTLHALLLLLNVSGLMRRDHVLGPPLRKTMLYSTGKEGVSKTTSSTLELNIPTTNRNTKRSSLHAIKLTYAVVF